MTTTSPLSPAARSSLCSHQVSNRRVPPHSWWSVSDWRWLFRMTSQLSLSLAALCHPSALSSKTALTIKGCPGRLLTTCLHWRWRRIGAAFQRNRLSQHCRDTTDASALSFCGILPLQLTCRLTVRSFSQPGTHLTLMLHSLSGTHLCNLCVDTRWLAHVVRDRLGDPYGEG